MRHVHDRGGWPRVRPAACARRERNLGLCAKPRRLYCESVPLVMHVGTVAAVDANGFAVHADGKR